MSFFAPFRSDETHGMVFRPGVERQLTSAGFGWKSIFAASQHELPYEANFAGVNDQTLIWHRNGPAAIEGEDGDAHFRHTVPSGGFHLIPSWADLKINLHNPLSTMHVYVRRAMIEEVASDLVLGDPARIEIASQIIDEERMLASLLAPLECALRQGSSDHAFCGDYISISISAHLVRHFSNGRLRSRALEKSPQATAVDRAIEFMRANLSESIGLGEVAQAADLSTSHLARVFKHRLGVPPHRYLIKLRVEQAMILLESTHMPIAEIALECGFAHQEHLTHQFRRLCGATPAAFRRDRQS